MTGYLLGKGFYQADIYRKSINYCNSIYGKDKSDKTKEYSYILLCETVLGNLYETNKANIDIYNLPFLKQGYNSLESISYVDPDLNKNLLIFDGLIIPLGNIINYNNQNRKSFNYNYTITSEP